MRLPKAVGYGYRLSVEAGREGAHGSAGDERHFRALLEEVANPSDSLRTAVQRERDDLHEHTALAQPWRSSDNALRAPTESEQSMHAFAAPTRFDLDTLKVRLTNGPLAGSEIEAYRRGQHLSIHVRARAVLRGDERPVSAKELCQALSAQLGLDVSVAMEGVIEHCDSPTTAPR
ncbi:hypothetical protein [Trinickia sp. EG282A]|uniref:hypothetical protein n=1 Tax=Trinickia sp. EG282A TaxID=3237013 RepID=UPI0034D1E5CD